MARAKRAGRGRVRPRNIFFGHVFIAGRQSRQRRDTVAAEEKQHGRYTAGKSKYYRPYVSRSKFILAIMHLRRVRVTGCSVAAAPTHLLTGVTPPAHAAQNLATFPSDFGNFVSTEIRKAERGKN